MASLVLKALAVFFATFSIPLIVNAQYEGDIYVPGRYRLTITQTPPDTSLTLVAGANKTCKSIRYKADYVFNL